jgi:hypothetical protein
MRWNWDLPVAPRKRQSRHPPGRAACGSVCSVSVPLSAARGRRACNSGRATPSLHYRPRRRRSTTHPPGPERSGGWRRRDFLVPRGMGEPVSPAHSFLRGGASPGEESLAAAIAARRSRRQPSRGQIAPSRGRVGRAPDSLPGEDVADMGLLPRPISQSRIKLNPNIIDAGMKLMAIRTGLIGKRRRRRQHFGAV